MNFINNFIEKNSMIFDVYNKKNLTIKSMFKHEKIKKLKEKKLAFLFSENSIGFIFFYIYMLKKNYVILLLNSDISIDDYNQLKTNYNPSAEVLPRLLLKKFNLNIKNINKTKYNYSLFLNNISQNYYIHEELCLLLSTSGSTGSKKFVKLSYENLNSNINAIVKSLNMKKSDSTVTTLPPEYSYGLSVINAHLNIGATIYLNKFTIFDKKFLEIFDTYKITNLNGVPFFYDLLKKISFFKKINKKNLKFITQAGGAIDEDTKNFTLKELKDSNTNFYIMYGSTETAPRMSCFNLMKNQNAKRGCIGLPIGDYKLKIKNNLNNIGKIYFYGKNIFKGYAKNIKNLKSVKNYNSINTGDLGELGSDGLYYLKSRSKRIIKISGIRFSLDEIETIIQDKLKNKVYCSGEDDSLICYYKNNFLERNSLNLLISKILKINHKYVKTVKIKNIPFTNRGKIYYEKLRKISEFN